MEAYLIDAILQVDEITVDDLMSLLIDSLADDKVKQIVTEAFMVVL